MAGDVGRATMGLVSEEDVGEEVINVVSGREV